MDQDRQRGLGRFAEWVGASAVAQDKLIRTLGLEHAAKADFAISRKLLCVTRDIPHLAHLPEPLLCTNFR